MPGPTQARTPIDDALKALEDELGQTVGFAQAARAMGVDVKTIGNWARSGKLNGAFKLVGRWRVSVDALRELAEKSR